MDTFIRITEIVVVVVIAYWVWYKKDRANGQEHFTNGKYHYRLSLGDNSLGHVYEAIKYFNQAQNHKLPKRRRIELFKMRAECYKMLGWYDDQLNDLEDLRRINTKDQWIRDEAKDLRNQIESQKALPPPVPEQELPNEEQISDENLLENELK